MSEVKVTGKGHRLHPISTLFLFLEAAKKLVLPFLVGGIGTQGMLFDERIMLGIGVLVSLFSVIQYWFYNYWLESDRLVVKDGILFKSLRQIPYARIQNINVEKNPLHRLFGVATLQLESASGSKPEAVIRVIADSEVARIKQIIKSNGQPIAHATQSIQSESASAEKSSIYAMTARDVATFGFISHRALVPIGVVFSILAQNDHYRDRFFDFVQRQVGALDVTVWTWSEWLLYGVVIGVLALLSIWMVSIGLAFLKLHGFTLQRMQQNIHASMGLLTQISAHIPLKRIQMIRIKTTPLHNFFKRCGIKMETAGGVTEESGISMTWLAPLIAPDAGQALLSKIQSEVDWSAIEWVPVAPRAWRRVFKYWLLVMALLLLPVIYFQWAWGLLLLLLLPLGYWYARRYVQRAAFAHNDQIIAFRSGVWFHHIAIVKINKVQNISRTETPFDRRNGMARLAVDTAGSSSFAKQVHIHYIDVADADRLFSRLSTQVSQARFVW